MLSAVEVGQCTVAALNLEMSSWQKEPPCLQVIYFQAQRLLVLSVYHAVRHALAFGSFHWLTGADEHDIS